MKLQKQGGENGRRLLKNTVMLYLLQFSSYLFSFITVPYQTRVLGPELFGVLGFAGAVMLYFQLFMDFGFLLSATEDVSKHREEPDYVCRKITTVAAIKAAFALISCAVMAGLCLFVGKFSDNVVLYFVYLAAFAVNSFLPDYIYRGLEQMTAVTVRTVLIRLFTCVMTFVFLRQPADYLLVPLLLLIGNTAAVLAAYADLFRRLGYRFVAVSLHEIRQDLKRSSVFFYSRIATTVYSATNTVVLGMVDKVGIITGCYTSADKVVTLSKNGLSPISDSLYPYMVKHRDFKLVKRLLAVFLPLIVLGCGVVWVFAEELCIFAFGEEFAASANILRAFLPVIALTLPNYIFGFPVLGAMGLSRYANYSIFAGSGVHLVGLALLLATGQVNGVTLASMTALSESVILAFRLVCVYRFRTKMKGD